MFFTVRFPVTIEAEQQMIQQQMALQAEQQQASANVQNASAAKQMSEMENEQ
jgi:hypothetical protein